MKTKLASFCASLVFLGLPLMAQSCPATVEEPVKLRVTRLGTVRHPLKVSLPEGCHANSDKPAESFLIPLKLTWGAGPVEVVRIVYPKPSLEKYPFAEKPMSVVSGAFVIQTDFERAVLGAPGPASIAGKLRYQACNDRMCFPPKTIDIKLPLLLE